MQTPQDNEQKTIVFQFRDGHYRHYEFLNWMVLSSYELRTEAVNKFTTTDPLRITFEIILYNGKDNLIMEMEQILCRTNWKSETTNGRLFRCSRNS